MPVTLTPVEQTLDPGETVVPPGATTIQKMDGPSEVIPPFIDDNSLAIFVILAFVAYLAIKLVIRFLPLILGVGAFVAFMKLFGIA
jgi:hypothetical protein